MDADRPSEPPLLERRLEAAWEWLHGVQRDFWGSSLGFHPHNTDQSPGCNFLFSKEPAGPSPHRILVESLDMPRALQCGLSRMEA